MPRILLRIFGAVALLGLIGPAAAQSDGSPPDNAIVVTGQRLPIVVNGKAARCRQLANDPQDLWVAKGSRIQLMRQSILLPRPDGNGFEVVDDRDQVSGDGVWRRVGRDIDQYVFRGPQDAKVLCIGSKGSLSAGYGQLRQIVDAAPYRGRRLRFTAWVASRSAGRVNFWLASADPKAEWLGHKPYECSPRINNVGDRQRGCIYDGGNSNGHDWHGSHGWTPVLIEIGPISKRATIISFGFVLGGSGDVWLYDPKVEVINPDDSHQRKGEVFVIGTDQDTSSR